MESKNIEALNVVLNVSINNVVEENKKLKKEIEFYKNVINEIKEEMGNKEAKYCDLVWLARTDGLTRHRNSNLYKIAREMADKHKEEFDKLCGENGDWYHGFNSGILALSRLVSDLSTLDPADDYYDDENNYIEPKKSLSLEDRRKEWRESGGMHGYDLFPMLDT